MYLFKLEGFFPEYMPRSRIAGSYANSIFSLLRNLHTVLHSGHANLLPPTVFEGSLFSTPSPAFLFVDFFLNWRIITLQYCVGFCHTTMEIRHNYVYPVPPEPPSLLPSHPSRSPQSARLGSLCYTAASH